MDLITYALCKKNSGESITYTLTADTENKTIVLTPSEGTAQVITVPYATDASTVNGHEVPELENGKIPANYLPSFVDNVDEYDNISLFPVVGESNRIYIDKSTNKTYRWSGTAYVEISESIALGETSSTAYRGDRGKIAYDHSQSAHAPSNAEANQNAFSNVKIDSDIINASAKTDTLEFIAGDNIILTPNVSNKKITVSQVPVRKTASGNIASFSDGTGDPFLEVKVDINPVQSGSGDPSPSNVRPISGWNGANVTKCGKNLFDYTNITEISIGTTTRNGSIFKKSGTYRISAVNGGGYMYARVFNADDTIKTTYNIIAGNNVVPATITISNGEYFALYDADTNNMGTSKDLFANWKAQVELNDTSTAYESYQGSTTSIPFHDSSDNPITVYGGTLNVTSGELTATHANIASLKNLTWYLLNGVFYASPPSATYNFDGLCSTYKKTQKTYTELADGEWTSVGGIGRSIWIKDSNYESTDDFKNSLDGVQLVYELATPQTYQLTPTQVSTLLGQNNIFADCGQIEVAYKTPFYTDLTTKNEVQVLINESITSALNASY